MNNSPSLISSDITPSASALSPRVRAKHSKHDPRQFITRTQVLNVINASAFAAQHLKKPLNTYLVIAFPTAEGWTPGRRTDEQQRSVRDRFVKVLRDWFDRRGLDPISTYSDENPPTGGIGPHINILLHIPEESWATHRADLFRCMRNAGGWNDKDCPDAPREPGKRRGVLIEPTALEGPMAMPRTQIKVAYILKGVHPDLVVIHDGKTKSLGELVGSASARDTLMSDKLKPQGNVRSARRAGASLPIGLTARKAAGWVDSKDITVLSPDVRSKAMVASMPGLVAASAQRTKAISVTLSARDATMEEILDRAVSVKAVQARDELDDDGIALCW